MGLCQAEIFLQERPRSRSVHRRAPAPRFGRPPSRRPTADLHQGPVCLIAGEQEIEMDLMARMKPTTVPAKPDLKTTGPAQPAITRRWMGFARHSVRGVVAAVGAGGIAWRVGRGSVSIKASTAALVGDSPCRDGRGVSERDLIRRIGRRRPEDASAELRRDRACRDRLARTAIPHAP